MARKSLQYLIFSELLLANDDWFDDFVCPESTMERDEEYYDYLAKRVVKMLKKEKRI